MYLIQEELQEDLGTFGGAVKNGWLKDNFAVEEVKIETDEKGVHLRCKMGRWFGKDDDIKLYPDGTGVNLDQDASDQSFQWKSIRARTTSFSKAILTGLAGGAAVGGLGTALAGIPAVKGAAATAGRGLAKAARKAGSRMMQTGVNPKATRTVAASAAGAAASLGAGGYGLYKAGQASANKQQEPVQEQVNEIAPLVGAAIGGAAGAIGGGLYALYKNRDNVIYYADGSYKSRKGTVSGRWDGSAEEEQRKGNTPIKKPTQPSIQVPGMPANFGSNPENVKIAQRYLVANHASISTSKSVDGIDGKLGPRTRRAIVAYMTQHNCDFAKFWADAQEYARLQKSHDDYFKERMDNFAKNPPKLERPEMTYQKPETLEEAKNKFYDIFDRMNNATILK